MNTQYEPFISNQVLIRWVAILLAIVFICIGIYDTLHPYTPFEYGLLILFAVFAVFPISFAALVARIIINERMNYVATVATVAPTVQAEPVDVPEARFPMQLTIKASEKTNKKKDKPVTFYKMVYYGRKLSIVGIQGNENLRHINFTEETRIIETYEERKPLYSMDDVDPYIAQEIFNKAQMIPKTDIRQVMRLCASFNAGNQLFVEDGHPLPYPIKEGDRGQNTPR